MSDTGSGESRLSEGEQERWRELHEATFDDLSDAEITTKIRLSVKRRFDYPEWVLMFEYGAPGNGGSVCDCLAANTLPSRNYKVVGFEFKASRSDWLREVRDGQKADYFVRLADEFYVVAPKGVVEDSEIPDGWGYLELKPNSEQLYKLQDSELTEHQQGGPDRRFWVRFLKQTVGGETNYSQADLDEARSRGYQEAKQDGITERDLDRDLDRLQRKARNWDELQDSDLDFIPTYRFADGGVETLERAWNLVRAIESDSYSALGGQLEHLEERSETLLKTVGELSDAYETLVGRVEDGHAPEPPAEESGGDGQ